MANLNETPSGNRLHIGFFGKRNSGKSSLVNAITGQYSAIVSDVAGTTADPVYKPMEIKGIGAVQIIDTAGFDDEGELGQLRIKKTLDAAKKTDIAVIVYATEDTSQEDSFEQLFKDSNTKIIRVVNDFGNGIAEALKQKFENAIVVKAISGDGVQLLKEKIVETAGKKKQSIVGDLAGDGDVVLLVMPQDIQAPEGRLILPQVQTIRELLDKKAIVVSTVLDKLSEALDALVKAPKLIITDSQCFKEVYEKKPSESLLSSFSVLFAAEKGDLDYFIEGAKAIAQLKQNSRVLIAEACTHAPLAEDIGREKIPRILKKRLGDTLAIDIVSGVDFPDDLKGYDLIIHCGGCMFNKKYIMSRVNQAKSQGVPMTNYGVVIAYMNGILDKISFKKA